MSRDLAAGAIGAQMVLAGAILTVVATAICVCLPRYTNGSRSTRRIANQLNSSD